MLTFKWEAALHNKSLEGSSGETENESQSSLSAEQEEALDQAMQAAILRKRMEANRGRSHHQD